MQIHRDKTEQFVRRALYKEVDVIGFLRILNPVNLEGLWIQAVAHVVYIRPDMKLFVCIRKKMNLLWWDERRRQIHAIYRGRAKEIRKNSQKNKADHHEAADNRHLAATEASPDKLRITFIF